MTYYNVGLYEKCAEIHHRWGWRNESIVDLDCEDYVAPNSVDDWEG